MRQAFLGSRALLYFDGRADAGLSRSVTVGVIGLVVGLLFGAIVTWSYDRKGFHGIAAPVEPGASAKPGAPAEPVAVGAGDGSKAAAGSPAGDGGKEQAAEHVSTSTES